jgi:hypothetical protein
MEYNTNQETLKLIQESIDHLNEIYWLLEKDTKFNVDKKVLDDLEDTWCKLEQIIVEFYHRL